MILIVKAIMFDFDGVIINSTTHSIKAHIEFAKRNNYRVPSFEEIRKLWGLSWLKIIQAIWGEDAKRFIREYIREYKKSNDLHKYPSIPKLHASLEKFKNSNLMLSLVSSRDMETLTFHLNNLDIPLDTFFFIHAPNDHSEEEQKDKTLKPAIKKFNEIGIAKNELLYVGDTLYDLQAARNENVAFIAVSSGIAERKEFEKEKINPEYILNSIAELPNLLGI